MTWTPHVTVATVVEQQGKFLLVEEYAGGNKAVYNQPAGHLDENESLQQAAVRETLEETGYEIVLSGYLGVTLYTAPSNGITYVRHTFVGKVAKHHSDLVLDEGIIGPVWMSYEDICQSTKMRSPTVRKTIEQYINHPLLPLSACY